MAKQRKWTDEQLREAVASSTMWVEVSRKLGLSGTGSCHYDVRGRARALALDTAHFTRAIRTGVWSEERVRAAVEASTNYPMALENLGLELGGGTDQKLRRRIRELGLSTMHFTRERTRTRTRWSDDDLRAAVASSRSVAAVIRKIGLIPAGGNYDQVQRRIRELAIDTSHFTGRGWNVGSHFRPRPPRPIEELLVANRWVATNHLKSRLFQAGLKTPQCEHCGWAERSRDGRVPVELDHANGDKTDNRIENLRILCPNCHALQPTHRGLNQKRRRK